MKYLTFLCSVALVLGFVSVTATSAGAQTLPAGCTSAYGYSPTSGAACNSVSTLPQGCTSASGFSTINGAACNGYTAVANGYNGSAVVNGNLNGCSSTVGYSTTSGLSCSLIASVNQPTVITTPVPVITDPGLPTTGAGSQTATNIALLLGAGGLALWSIVSLRRKSA